MRNAATSNSLEKLHSVSANGRCDSKFISVYICYELSSSEVEYRLVAGMPTQKLKHLNVYSITKAALQCR